MRVTYVPELNVQYTFRRLKNGKPVYETYQFYGEITNSGRYILFEIRNGYATSFTLEHFSYRMRKQFVRQKDLLTGKTYYTVSRRTKNGDSEIKMPEENKTLIIVKPQEKSHLSDKGILEELKTPSEEELEKSLQDAIITINAFTTNQRQRIKEFNNERCEDFINEIKTTLTQAKGNERTDRLKGLLQHFFCLNAFAGPA